ncbi:MAG: hypothetical protein KTR25_19360 [Myxococcales bacterium]|nr:hypothetical protein [Myxococcales bacterium]
MSIAADGDIRKPSSPEHIVEITWVEPKFLPLRRAMPAARLFVDSYRINSSGLCCKNPNRHK